MIVKALKIPVRYSGVTYPTGQIFEIEDNHFDARIVEEATTEEAEEHMTKYSKAADRSGSVKKTEEVLDYSTFTETELKKVKNEKLEAYLDSKGINYAADDIKADYIELILRK